MQFVIACFYSTLNKKRSIIILLKNPTFVSYKSRFITSAEE